MSKMKDLLIRWWRAGQRDPHRRGRRRLRRPPPSGFRTGQNLESDPCRFECAEAMAYLKGEDKYANRDECPLPDLLLVDLKLPRYNGFEILSWARQQPGLATLRILVLTSSDEIRDVNEAYHIGANSFLAKPYDFQDLVELSALIQRYWLEVSRTPESFRPPRNPENGKTNQS